MPLLEKGVTINDESDDDSDDVGDISSHNSGGRLHETLFDVDFLEIDQNDVGTLRIKVPVHCKVETVSVESR